MLSIVFRIYSFGMNQVSYPIKAATMAEKRSCCIDRIVLSEVQVQIETPYNWSPTNAVKHCSPGERPQQDEW